MLFSSSMEKGVSNRGQSHRHWDHSCMDLYPDSSTYWTSYGTFWFCLLKCLMGRWVIWGSLGRWNETVHAFNRNAFPPVFTGSLYIFWSFYLPPSPVPFGVIVSWAFCGSKCAAYERKTQTRKGAEAGEVYPGKGRGFLVGEERTTGGSRGGRRREERAPSHPVLKRAWEYGGYFGSNFRERECWVEQR